jgi:hypothetical protein
VSRTANQIAAELSKASRNLDISKLHTPPYPRRQIVQMPQGASEPASQQNRQAFHYADPPFRRQIASDIAILFDYFATQDERSCIRP